MRVFSLKSGSRGNCTLVVTSNHNLLIDVGYSMKRIEQDLLISYGIDFEDISFILITHNHTDHILSFNAIYNKHKHIKFVTDKQLKLSIEQKNKKEYDDERFFFVDGVVDGNELMIGNFEVTHDTYCLSWVIRDKKDSSGLCFIADNGMMPYKVNDIDLLKIPYTHYCIESNYDQYLQYLDSKRDIRLKRRVLSNKGHSDNFNAIQKLTSILTVLDLREEEKVIQSVLFTHLSEDCNSEEKAMNSHNAFIETWGHKTVLKNVNIQYAKQNEIIEM